MQYLVRVDFGTLTEDFGTSVISPVYPFVRTNNDEDEFIANASTVKEAFTIAIKEINYVISKMGQDNDHDPFIDEFHSLISTLELMKRSADVLEQKMGQVDSDFTLWAYTHMESFSNDHWAFNWQVGDDDFGEVRIIPHEEEDVIQTYNRYAYLFC